MKLLKTILKIFSALLITIFIISFIFLKSKTSVRNGELQLHGLKHSVKVIYDKWGVPHIYAKNQKDAYRALGFIHAQDRLFQMEIIRRLAKGELAEILGEKLIKTDKFFRTLRIKAFSKEYVKSQSKESLPMKLNKAYIDGVNQYIKDGKTPIEFNILGIPKKPFTLEDSVAIGGYIAIGFATAYKTEPLLTYIRDNLGVKYLKDLGYFGNHKSKRTKHASNNNSMRDISKLALDIENLISPFGLFEGSNAWAVSGKLTKSKKPILASDPHIAFGVPSVWYESHITAPGYEIYGHFLTGVPMALLGHNKKVAWGITMFKNDDMDFFREKVNPKNPDQILRNGKWQNLKIEREIIKVKGKKDVVIRVRSSHHGPIINDVTKGFEKQKAPIAMWWAYLEKSNRMFEGYYEFSTSNSLVDMRKAAKKIHAPGINIVAADSSGNIAWWALGKIPIRPDHVDSNFILDGSSGKDDYKGFFTFDKHPQSFNPTSGMIISSNHKPKFIGNNSVPGYYNIPNRAQRIKKLLLKKGNKLTLDDMKAIQLDDTSDFHKKIQAIVVPILKSNSEINKNKNAMKALDYFSKWDGNHNKKAIGPTVFVQFYYSFMKAIFKDELKDKFYKIFLGTKVFDKTIPIIISNPKSPWWDNINTKEVETRKFVLVKSWLETIKILEKNLGDDVSKWYWQEVHTLEHKHPIGRKKPFNKIFNIGPFSIAGGREVVNNMSFKISGGHHFVKSGPSTRRLIDFKNVEQSLGILPTGQSGYFFDKHYSDQASMFVNGKYRKQLMNKDEILKSKEGVLILKP